MPRVSAAGFAALALVATLGACHSSHHPPVSTAASAIPANVIAYVSYSIEPSASQRSGLAAAMSAKGAKRRTFVDARKQLLAGLGRPIGIDVDRDVMPWATGEIALAVLPDTKAVLVVGVRDATKAGVALDRTKVAHVAVGGRELIADDRATLDKARDVAVGSLASSPRYAQLVAAAPASRIGLGLVDTRVCRAGAASTADFSIRASGGAVVVEGTAGGRLADMAPGEPSATNSLPVDTLAAVTAFDSRAVNDVADVALGCIPSFEPTPAAASILSAGLPPGVPVNFGVDIDRDVTPWARGETVVAIGTPRSPASIANVGIIARPADSNTAAAALPRIEDALARAGQFQWVARDQGGVHFLAVPNPVAGVGALQPAIGFVNGRVVLASSPDYFVSLARPSDPKLGTGAAYQADVSQPAGGTLARAVVHLADLRDLFGGRLPLRVTADDPFLAGADTVVFTLTRDNALTRFRLVIRF